MKAQLKVVYFVSYERDPYGLFPVFQMANPLNFAFDLGTTYSCVGVFQHGNDAIIANDQSNGTTSSYETLSDSGRLTSDAAKNPSNAVFIKSINPDEVVACGAGMYIWYGSFVT